MERATGFGDHPQNGMMANENTSIQRVNEQALLTSLLASLTGTDERDRLVACLLSRFGSLRDVIRASKSSLNEVTGFGDQVHHEITKIRDLAIAITRTEIDDQPVFDQYEKIIAYCRTILAGENLEQLHAIFLNKSMQLIGDKHVRSGTVDHVTVYPRELIELAMAFKASGIILVHNHPSGIVEPSRADIEMTNALVNVGKILGIEIMDHLIIGRRSTYSFRNHNLINGLSQ